MEFFHGEPGAGNAKPLVREINRRCRNRPLQTVFGQPMALAEVAGRNRNRHATVMGLAEPGSCFSTPCEADAE